MNLEFHIPKGTLRQRQKEETEKLILETARGFFAQMGYRKTTIRKVAEKAGLGLGTIFNYFPDKASLLIATFLDDLAAVQSEALQSMPNDVSVREQFLHLSRSFYQYYARHPSLSRTLLKESWFTRGKWADELMAEAAAYVELVKDLLLAAKERGDIRPEADCQLIAVAFFSHYLNTLMMGLSQAEFSPGALVDLLGQLIDQMMIGVGVK